MNSKQRKNKHKRQCKSYDKKLVKAINLAYKVGLTIAVYDTSNRYFLTLRDSAGDTVNEGHLSDIRLVLEKY